MYTEGATDELGIISVMPSCKADRAEVALGDSAADEPLLCLSVTTAATLKPATQDSKGGTSAAAATASKVDTASVTASVTATVETCDTTAPHQLFSLQESGDVATIRVHLPQGGEQCLTGTKGKVLGVADCSPKKRHDNQHFTFGASGRLCLDIGCLTVDA
jgi:hypothetical protein